MLPLFDLHFANLSWEFGTATEVILERYYPTLSVYSVSNNVPIDVSSEPVPKEIFDAVDPFLSARKPGPGPIVADDLSGGSVSLGVGVMIAGLTVGNRPMTERKFTAEQYGEVAQAQLDYLLTKVPRGPNRELSDVGTRFQARLVTYSRRLYLWSSLMLTIYSTP